MDFHCFKINLSILNKGVDYFSGVYTYTPILVEKWDGLYFFLAWRNLTKILIASLWLKSLYSLEQAYVKWIPKLYTSSAHTSWIYSKKCSMAVFHQLFTCWTYNLMKVVGSYSEKYCFFWKRKFLMWFRILKYFFIILLSY